MRAEVNEYLDIVGDFYDCIANPSHWNVTLGKLSERLSSTIATIAMLDVASSTAVFPAATGPEEIVRPLIEIYHAHMPLYDTTLRMELDVPITMTTFFKLSGEDGPERFATSRVGQEWAIPNRLQYGLCLLVARQTGRTGNLVINRTSESGEFSEAEIGQLAFLAPHIRRAITISDLFGEGQRHVEMFSQIIDSLASAVLVVDRDMRLQYANPMAEELLQAGTLVRVGAGRVGFQLPQAEATIRNAIITGERLEIALGGLGINVPTSNMPQPMVASVLPLHRRNWSGGPTTVGTTAIFFGAPQTGSTQVMDMFAALYGLSAAERRVTAMVTDGKSRIEISQIIGVRENTVKSQLNAVFDKTGARGQRALTRLIREFNSPLTKD